MSEESPQDPKNVQMRCLPCVMPYTEDLGTIVQPGTKPSKPAKSQQKQCHGNVEDHNGSCQCTPERPCCTYEDIDQHNTEKLLKVRKSTKIDHISCELLLRMKKDDIDGSPEFRLEKLKDKTLTKIDSENRIYVKSCEYIDASQPCDCTLAFYKARFSTPLLCLERIKNPVKRKYENIDETGPFENDGCNEIKQF